MSSFPLISPEERDRGCRLKVIPDCSNPPSVAGYVPVREVNFPHLQAMVYAPSQDQDCKLVPMSCAPMSCQSAWSNHFDSYQWSWLTELIFYFFFFFVIMWIILYSLAPPLLLSKGGQVDTAKVLISALLISLIIVVGLGVARYMVTLTSNNYQLADERDRCVRLCKQ